ncbi:hypothetical protein B5S31_g3886 [[Candida] boidinii]|nr:hypothetical protein B5S31_g3886 [[Candida] boidinii]
MSYQEDTKRRFTAGSIGKDEHITKRQNLSVQLQKNNNSNTNKTENISIKDKRQKNSSNAIDNKIYNKYKKLLNKIENQPNQSNHDSIKPREEIDFEIYYPDLDPKEPLQVIFSDDSTELIADNSEFINNYTNLKKITDESVMSGLRKPNFRKIPEEDYSFDKFFTDPEDKNKLFDTNYKLTEKDTEFGYHRIHPVEKEKENTESTISDQQNQDENGNIHQEYIRSDNISGSLISNTLLPDSKNSKFQTLYDMDECDLFFLKYINKHRINLGLNAITMEIFETTITFLENESYFLEKLSLPTLKNQVIDEEKAMIRASLYGSDDGTGCAPEVDQRCAVCNLSECDATNDIVFCDGCNIAVHQECYGVAFIPEGPWLCRKCLISRNEKSRCIFCPSSTGAFKQTDHGFWGHAICTLWIHELYFANPSFMEPIEGIQYIPQSRWKLNCYICKQKIGACIQCSKPSCFLAYHATCAKRSDLCMILKNGFQAAMTNHSSMVSYCEKHTPLDWLATHDVKAGIERTRLYFEHMKLRNLKRFSKLKSNSNNGVLKNTYKQNGERKNIDTGLKSNGSIEVLDDDDKDEEEDKEEDEEIKKMIEEDDNQTNEYAYLENNEVMYFDEDIMGDDDEDNDDEVIRLTMEEAILLKETKNTLFKSKTLKNSTIVPNLWCNKLLEFYNKHDILIESVENFIIDICKYWTAKRDYYNGLPLIRKPDSIKYGELTNIEVDNRLVILDRIFKDIKNLSNFSKLIFNRSNLNKEKVTVELLNFEIINLTKFKLIKNLFDEFKKYVFNNNNDDADDKFIKKNKLFIEIEYKVNKFKFNSVNEFIEELKKLTMYIVSFSEDEEIVKSAKEWIVSSVDKYDECINLQKLLENNDGNIFKDYLVN